MAVISPTVEGVTPNIALHAHVSQSSVDFGGVSERAVDGTTVGFFSMGSVTHTQKELEPWLEIVLPADGRVADNMTDVGMVRVFNRVQQPARDEIQIVSTHSYRAIHGGGFKLIARYRNDSAVSAEIKFNAVPALVDEDDAAPVASGRAPGESMQSILEATGLFPRVSVTRTGPNEFNEYRWLVTFSGVPGNVPELEPIDVNLWNAAAPRVKVHTQREGSSNFWYNYQDTLQEISGNLFPAWIMCLPSPLAPEFVSPGIQSLHAALQASTWSAYVTDVTDEVSLTPTRGTRCAAIRVQAEGTTALSIAEVQVHRSFQSEFAGRAWSAFSGDISALHGGGNSHGNRLADFNDIALGSKPMPETLVLPPICSYQYGSPIASGLYEAQDSLHSAFDGETVAGVWTLRLRDAHHREILTAHRHNLAKQARPMEAHSAGEIDLTHGVGALSAWAIVIEVRIYCVCSVVLRESCRRPTAEYCAMRLTCS